MFKIGDFDISKVLNSNEKILTLVGTEGYMSSEIYETGEYSFPADVFSAGVIVYEMMSKKKPFTVSGRFNISSLLAGKFELLSMESGDFTPGLINLVHSCLAKDPSTHPSAAAVLASSVVADEAFRLQAEHVLINRVEQMLRDKAEAKRANKERLEQRMTDLERRVMEERRASETEIMGLKQEIVELKRFISIFSSSSTSSSPSSTSTAFSSSSSSSTNVELVFQYVPNLYGGYSVNQKNVLFSTDGLARSVFLDHTTNTGKIYNLRIRASRFADHSVRVGAAEQAGFRNIFSELLGNEVPITAPARTTNGGRQR